MADYDLPENCRFSAEDEWVRAESDDRWVIGVSDFAQQQLGDVVFVELPEVGSQLVQGETFGVIESVKAVSDLFAPASGEVVAVNELLEDTPEKVNEDCYGEGWIVAIKPGADTAKKDLDALMDAAAYRENVAGREA